MAIIKLTQIDACPQYPHIYKKNEDEDSKETFVPSSDVAV